jgi:putative oxidoreductase
MTGSIDKTLLGVGAALVAATAITGLHAVATMPFTGWFMASAVGWIAAMAAALALAWRHGFFGVIAALFATIVVGRLFGTVRLAGATNTTNDPLLLAETGEGVPLVMWLATAAAVALVAWIAAYIARHRDVTPWGTVGAENWALFFVRNYVGLMFIGHFSGHIFAGPAQFAIFEGYFGSIGLEPAAAMVVLAGVVELLAGIGLCLGLFTRFAALLGAVFLYLSMLWGNHFPVGYIWILPTGGWEFGIFWAAMVACFVVVGGGTISLDHAMRVQRRTGGHAAA